MNPAAMQRAISEIPDRIRNWVVTEEADDYLPPHVMDMLPGGQFGLDAFTPVDVSPLRVAYSVSAIESRLRLALLITMLDGERLARFADPQSLLHEYSQIPIRITHLTISSLKMTVEGDAKEIAALLGRKPPINWRRRLTVTVAVMFGAGALLTHGDSASPNPVPLPSIQEVITTVNEACGTLPPGTVVKLKFSVFEAEIPCGDSRTQQ